MLSIFKALNRLINLCIKNRINLIHTDGPRNTFYSGLIARIKKIPLIWHVRASNTDIFDRFLYILSSKIILVAGNLKSRFRWIDKHKKISIVYNAVDISIYNPSNSNGLIREKYGIGKSDIIVLSIARIERLKGQRFLIEACGILAENKKGIYILLAGEVTEPYYMKECKDIAQKLGVLNNIVFTGQVNNISDIIREADIFISPSLFEAFPRSIIEAMSAGKPVIVTDVGGCSEAVEDKVSGFVVPAKNSIALAEKIRQLKMDANLREKMGDAAKKRVENNFGIEQHVKRIQNIYKEVLIEHDVV